MFVDRQHRLLFIVCVIKLKERNQIDVLSIVSGLLWEKSMKKWKSERERDENNVILKPFYKNGADELAALLTMDSFSSYLITRRVYSQ